MNDTGGQIRLLGESLLARRRGEAVPEGGYQGEYVAELAEGYDGPDDVVEAGRFASERILENIRATLDRLDIVFDEWYSQASIEESGQVAETIELLRERGLVYEQDGAMWLRSTEFGDSRDRVLVKSNGDATYLAGDLAYHRDKFLVRGFDRVIDVFGADHHGQVASLKAGVVALGVERDRLEIRLGQLVSIVGRRMSKRSGHFVKLDELIDEIGPDAVRLLSLISSIDQATTLDLDLVTRRSMDNPVFYVQYAHARIASIERRRAERGIERVPIGDGSARSARPRPRACSAALPRRSAVRRRGGGERSRPAQGDELGPAAGGRLPRLLPRLPRSRGRGPTRAHPGPAVAGRGRPHRSRHRARPARCEGTRRDVTEAPSCGRGSSAAGGPDRPAGFSPTPPRSPQTVT